MKIDVVSYNSEWKIKFEEEKKRLQKFIPLNNLIIEHIGSTSIKGLSAKPIIDILIGVENDEDLIILQNSLEGRDDYVYYQKWEPVMPFRKFFVKVENVPTELNTEIPKVILVGEEQAEIVLKYRVYHIHAVCVQHEFWKTQLVFRDYLRENKNVLKEYEELKLELSKKDWKRSEDYSAAKSDFIQNILSRLDY